MRDADVPLFVNLDGVLVHTDVTVEALFGLIRERPWTAALALAWAWKGAARLKHEVAARAAIDVAALPYDREVLSVLRGLRAEGRRLVLASAADRAIVRRVAALVSGCEMAEPHAAGSHARRTGRMVKEWAAAVAFRVVVAALLLGGGAGAALAEGRVVALAPADRQVLESILGKGVVGAAVAADPLTSGLEAMGDGTRSYRIVRGKGAGGTESQTLQAVTGGGADARWRYAVGSRKELLLARGADGGLVLRSERDEDRGVVSHFSPPEPLLVPGLEPGASRDYTVDVKVYDIGKPDRVTHTGRLSLTYSYLGAYEVTVPAGRFDAVLVPWVYKGKVGPANVRDTQYRLLAAKRGMVAEVELKKISALLIYRDNSEVGKVLAAGP